MVYSLSRGTFNGANSFRGSLSNLATDHIIQPFWSFWSKLMYWKKMELGGKKKRLTTCQIGPLIKHWGIASYKEQSHILVHWVSIDSKSPPETNCPQTTPAKILQKNLLGSPLAAPPLWQSETVRPRLNMATTPNSPKSSKLSIRKVCDNKGGGMG